MLGDASWKQLMANKLASVRPKKVVIGQLISVLFFMQQIYTIKAHVYGGAYGEPG